MWSSRSSARAIGTRSRKSRVFLGRIQKDFNRRQRSKRSLRADLCFLCFLLFDVSGIRFPKSRHSCFYFLLSTFLLVLLIADVFHPLNDFSIQSLLNGYMRHRRSRTCAMPMFLLRPKPDHITWPDFLDRTALALNPPKTRRDDQRLTEWNVTLAPRTRAGSGAWNSASIRTVPVKYSAGPLLELCEPDLFISIFLTVVLSRLLSTINS